MPELAQLEASLQQYVESGATEPFDYDSLPRVDRDALEEPEAPDLVRVSEAPAAAAAAPTAMSAPVESADNYGDYAAQLAAVPALAAFGAPLTSSPIAGPTALTESETEYMVTAVKHVFAEHIVLQYNVTNTLAEMVLEDIVMVVGGLVEAGLEEEFILPITSLSAASPSGVVYVSLKRDSVLPFPLATLSNTLRFVSKEVDPTSGEPEPEGYQDEYQTEELDLGVADYVQQADVDFAATWDTLEASASETFALTALESLDASCSTLIEILGMRALGGTETPANPSVHTMMLAGRLACPTGLELVLARVRMMYQPSDGVTMELAVRAPSDEACLFVLSAIA